MIYVMSHPEDYPDDDYLEDFCPVCGGYLEWVSCYSCFGQGEFDLFDEDPFYYDEGDTERCDACDGEGGYFECTNLPHADEAKTEQPQP